MNGELIAPMTYEETMTSDFFEAWFQKFLLPTLTTGQRASCQEITVILVKKEAEKFHFLLLFYRIYFSFSELLTSAFLADLI
ncbi:Spn1, transposase Orf2 [Streptococcus pneumoniae]|nr:Spn1, transposase Orf2 [Streptococcus pneumoniae]